MIEQTELTDLKPEVFKTLTAHRRLPALINFRISQPELFHPATLSELRPDAPVQVRVYKHDRQLLPRDKWTSYCDYSSMSIREYVTKVADGSAAKEKLYLALFEVGGLPQAKPFSSYLDEIANATGLIKRPHNDVNLWIAPPSHSEALHYDGDDGTLLQFHGSKHITLIPPKRSGDLYPFPILRSGMPSNFSRIDLAAIDKNKYPRALRALESSIQFTLHAGQALFIPAGWWHQVEASDTPEGVVSINRFWSTRHLPYIASRPRVALIALMAEALASLRS